MTWTSPDAGTIAVTGSVWLARSIGRSVDWTLAINGLTIGVGSLFDGDAFDRANPFTFAAGAGGGGALDNLAVKSSGDVVQLLLTTAGDAGEFVGVNLNVDFTPDSSQPAPVPGTLLLVGAGLGVEAAFER